MLCDYGCGKEAEYTLKNGKHCCSKPYTKCQQLKNNHSNRLKAAYASGSRPKSDFGGKRNWAKGKNLVSNDDMFIENGNHSPQSLKERILKESLLDNECASCSLVDTWQGKPIVLELDHINGINNDNRLTNLRLLCPNCHSQTSTFRGRNINSGKIKVTDEQLIEAYNESGNIRKALIQVGLAPKGGNYSRIAKLLNKD